MIRTIISQDEMTECFASMCRGYHIFQPSTGKFGIRIEMLHFGAVGGYYSDINDAKEVAEEFMCFLVNPERYGQKFRFPKEENGKVMWGIL